MQVKERINSDRIQKTQVEQQHHSNKFLRTN